MDEIDYSIRVGYSTSDARRGETSMDVFREIMNRGLEFSAGVGPAPTGHELQAIRVSVTRGPTTTSYSPLSRESNAQFLRALDEIAEAQKEPASRV